MSDIVFQLSRLYHRPIIQPLLVCHEFKEQLVVALGLEPSWDLLPFRLFIRQRGYATI